MESRTQLKEREWSEHKAYVTGAIVFAAAFLEASINELYLEAVDGNTDRLSGLSDQQNRRFGQTLGSLVEQQQVLGKYQVPSLLAEKADLIRSSAPYQGADGLIKIRNASSSTTDQNGMLSWTSIRNLRTASTDDSL